MDIKSGYKTTEFWTWVIPMGLSVIQALVNIFHGQPVAVDPLLLGVTGINGAAYTISRGQAKKGK